MTMIGAPSPPNESARLLDLAHYEILDTPAEDVFDRIARLAAHLLRTPLACINFIDGSRQWSKAAYGPGPGTAPRRDSFCAWTILGTDPVVIENTCADPRFAQHPAVTGEPHLRMYAGAPLITPTGHCIGTLCVADSEPHALTRADLQDLRDLAALVVDELELRAHTLETGRRPHTQHRRNGELQRGPDQTWVLDGLTGLLNLELSPEDMTLKAAALLGNALNADYLGLLLFEGEELREEAAYRTPQVAPAMAALPTPLPEWSNSVTMTLKDLHQPLYLDDYPLVPGALNAVAAAGVQQIAWLPLGTRRGVTALLMAMRLRSNPVMRWRGSDQGLLTAAGRSVRSALDRQLEAELAHQQARHDALTGSLNRRAMYQDLIQRHLNGQPFLLAELDLDGLKTLNDQEGRAQGDKLLQVFARTLKVELGKEGEVYRTGGDEFVVLADTDEEAVHDAVDVAVLAARQVGTLRGASVGIARSSEGVGETLLGLAEERLYAVKCRRLAVRQEGVAPGLH
ncbi:sensor domain-containing diguanylate cyclase [Deinococcus saxicola]|uniref:sensor domain-containing diguanylate cyclase n=1 Tax=Deinococcus saxicola TaxID=249406 RepID=UPI0039EF7E25